MVHRFTIATEVPVAHGLAIARLEVIVIDQEFAMSLFQTQRLENRLLLDYI
jgi:hypothetical protein